MGYDESLPAGNGRRRHYAIDSRPVGSLAPGELIEEAKWRRVCFGGPLQLHQVTGTGDEDGRLDDLRALEMIGQLHVAINVAAPVDWTTEASLPMLGDVVVEVILRQPRSMTGPAEPD